GSCFHRILEDWQYASSRMRFGDGFGCLRARSSYACVLPFALDHYQCRDRETLGASLSSRGNTVPCFTRRLVFCGLRGNHRSIRISLQLLYDDHLRRGCLWKKLCKPSFCIRTDILCVGAYGRGALGLRKCLSLDFRGLPHCVVCWSKVHRRQI